MVEQTLAGLGRLNHNQNGDPALVAQAILKVVAMPNPPARLYLGTGALMALQSKIEEVKLLTLIPSWVKVSIIKINWAQPLFLTRAVVMLRDSKKASNRKAATSFSQGLLRLDSNQRPAD